MRKIASSRPRKNTVVLFSVAVGMLLTSCGSTAGSSLISAPADASSLRSRASSHDAESESPVITRLDETDETHRIANELLDIRMSFARECGDTDATNTPPDDEGPDLEELLAAPTIKVMTTDCRIGEVSTDFASEDSQVADAFHPILDQNGNRIGYWLNDVGALGLDDVDGADISPDAWREAALTLDEHMEGEIARLR